MWYTQKSEGDIISPAAGVRSSCELPGGSWDQTPGPLQEQQALPTIEHQGILKLALRTTVTTSSENQRQ